MKKKALQEIKLCEAQLIQLLEELKGLAGEIKSNEKHWDAIPARARVKNRIGAVRKDLLQLKKTIYEWEVWR
jgi:hypothetical protein